MASQGEGHNDVMSALISQGILPKCWLGVVRLLCKCTKCAGGGGKMVSTLKNKTYNNYGDHVILTFLEYNLWWR